MKINDKVNQEQIQARKNTWWKLSLFGEVDDGLLSSAVYICFFLSLFIFFLVLFTFYLSLCVCVCVLTDDLLVLIYIYRLLCSNKMCLALMYDHHGWLGWNENKYLPFFLSFTSILIFFIVDCFMFYMVVLCFTIVCFTWLFHVLHHNSCSCFNFWVIFTQARLTGKRTKQQECVLYDYLTF